MTYSAAFASSQVLGVQEDVQLREQDFGNFQGRATGSGGAWRAVTLPRLAWWSEQQLFPYRLDRGRCKSVQWLGLSCQFVL